jgi:phosphate transport system permease protein
MTSWEVVRRISLPAVRTGLVGAVALAWGRALGETMAVLMVGGSAANYLPHNVFSPISTMAATIAEQLDSALTDASGMALHALSELAWTLIILTVTTNALARLLVARGGMARRHAGRRLRREEESPWTNAQSA